MNVLIADDDTTTRLTIRYILARMGYELVEAENGQDALSILSSLDGPRLALLDWHMPGLSGIDVCRKIREKKFAVPPYIILLTARNSEEDIIAGLEVGANDYITKPFRAGELRARLQAGQRVVELQYDLANRLKELQTAMSHIKRLHGLIPICSYCHKIRTEENQWLRLEQYIEEHSEAEFSHGICQDCQKKYFPLDEDSKQ